MTDIAPLPGLELTPTGTQSLGVLFWRRCFVAALNVVTYLGLLGSLGLILGAGGWSWIDVILFMAFAIRAPWAVIGFWNAVIGLVLLQTRRDPAAAVSPYALNSANSTAPVLSRTAIIMTLRNEDPERALRRLKLVKNSLDATPYGGRFAYFVLSDSNLPEAGAAEEAAIAAWQTESAHPDLIHYRRRAENTGYKAGNVLDFCERWGHDFDFLIGLDADSLMTAETILKFVRITEANPKLGILQSLVVGMPSESAFARCFQFGMRHGLRLYIAGSAWWAGDCGPYWGHNAVVRIKPFLDHCKLEPLPGKPPFGGHILSHDQVEATFMRRAGYEVRVLPDECGSYEENPPTLLQFAQRDVRWCQGNLQYFKLLATPGLFPMSRFQLIWAILMFIGLPAKQVFLLAAALKPFDGEALAAFPASLAIAFYITYILMFLTPKLAGLLDTVLTPGGIRRYGGVLKLLISALIENIYYPLLIAVTDFRTTIAIAGLLFGKSVSWSGQARDAHGISWQTALEGLWPQLAFGLLLLLLMAIGAPGMILWSLPLTAGLLLGVPLCVVTASPEAGAFFTRNKLCGIPEDFDPPAEVAAALNRSR